MTILGELRAEVQEALRRSPTKTLLWLDPQHEWERLLDQLATELELVKYDGSQLEVRMKIELEPAKTSRIVYLPLARRALSPLKEYEFTLPVGTKACSTPCAAGALSSTATTKRFCCLSCPVWRPGGPTSRWTTGVT